MATLNNKYVRCGLLASAGIRLFEILAKAYIEVNSLAWDNSCYFDLLRYGRGVYLRILRVCLIK